MSYKSYVSYFALLCLLTACAPAETLVTSYSPGGKLKLEGLQLAGQRRLPVTATGSDTASPAAPATDIKRVAGIIENIMVWKVTSPEKKDSYIMGVINHPLKEGYQFPAEIAQIISQTEMLVVESDITKIQDALNFVQANGADAEQDLKKDLSETEWAALEAQIKEVNAGLLASLSQVKPWFLNFVLESPQAATGLAMANVLRGSAQTLSIPVSFLERITDIYTVQSQVLDYKQELERLKLNLKQTAEARFAAQAELFKAYNNSDLEKIEAYKAEIKQKYPAYYDIIFRSRYADWLIKLDQALGTQSIAMAVDIRALVGDDGILNLLKKKGFEVEPLQDLAALKKEVQSKDV